MSQRYKQQSIQIANPVPGGGKWTSAKKARDYVRRNRAVFLDDGRLWFLPHHSRVSAAATLLRVRVPILTPYDYAANVGIATINAIRHLPTARAPELVLATRRTVRSA